MTNTQASSSSTALSYRSYFKKVSPNSDGTFDDPASSAQHHVEERVRRTDPGMATYLDDKTAGPKTREEACKLFMRIGFCADHTRWDEEEENITGNYSFQEMIPHLQKIRKESMRLAGQLTGSKIQVSSLGTIALGITDNLNQTERKPLLDKAIETGGWFTLSSGISAKRIQEECNDFTKRVLYDEVIQGATPYLKMEATRIVTHIREAVQDYREHIVNRLQGDNESEIKDEYEYVRNGNMNISIRRTAIIESLNPMIQGLGDIISQMKQENWNTSEEVADFDGLAQRIIEERQNQTEASKESDEGGSVRRMTKRLRTFSGLGEKKKE